MKLFISHITEEAAITQVFKEFVEAQFLRQIRVFASFDLADLTPGEQWLERIALELRQSRVLLVLCSRSSLSRPWINFEVGFGWGTEKTIIPICHSGQRKDQLPHPFSRFQALQIEDETFCEQFVRSMCLHFKIGEPHFEAGVFREKLREAMAKCKDVEPGPQTIYSPKERTRVITDDLQTLLSSKRVSHETVWTSAFLTALAIGDHDPYPDIEKDYVDMLLRERDLLLALGKKGCHIKCIISPVNEHNIQHFGIEYATKRTERLIEFLRSNDEILQQCDWAASELLAQNLYVIGEVSCFEGYKKAARLGYGLTFRHTSREVIQANKDTFNARFDELANRMLVDWSKKEEGVLVSREVRRLAALHCLEASLDFLKRERSALGSSKRKSSRPNG